MTALWRSSLIWGFFVVDTVTTALQALEPKSFIHFSLYRYCVRASRPSKTFHKQGETYWNIAKPFSHLSSPWKSITDNFLQYFIFESDQHLISPYNISPSSNIKVMRIKEMIPQPKKLLVVKQILLDRFASKCIDTSLEKLHTDVRM